MTANRVTSLTRTRNAFLVALLVLPITLFALFERQARRLDALAAEGLPVEATVTRVNQGTTFYAYRVDGVEHTWNVKREEAPFAPGSHFAATYLPRDPGLSRPFAERGLAVAEATKNRSFAWKAVLAVLGFLGVFTLLAQVELAKAKRGETKPGEVSRDDIKRRLGFAVTALVPLVGLITWFHLSDARARGEPVWPTLLGLGLAIGVFTGALVFVTRQGPGQVQSRAARLTAWAAPIAVGIALLRLVALVLGH